MFIRIGYEIVIESKADTVLILALSPHSSFEGRVIGSSAVQAEPDLPLETFLDSFGNRLTRLRALVGPLVLWSDGMVEGTTAALTPRRSRWLHRIAGGVAGTAAPRDVLLW